MKLTQKHEGLITRYLLDVAVKFDAVLTEEERQKGLNKLEAHIHRELDALDLDPIEDAHVYRVLDECGTPRHQANKRINEERPNYAHAPNRVWLGVCAHNAKRFGFPVRLVRIAFFIAGIIPFTAPIALFLYLFAYIEKYFRADKLTEPKVNTFLFFSRSVLTLAILFGLKWSTGYFVQGLRWGFKKFLDQPIPDIGDWNTLHSDGPQWFAYAILFCFPIAMLSGLPLANNWNKTLHRISQAGVAIYATFLAYGIACLLTGIILHYVKDFSGFNLDLIPILGE